MTSPSVLDRVNEYLALRRGLGFDLDTPSWLLRDFARYADRVSHQAGHVTTDLAVQWALSSRSPDPAQAIRRLSTVRVFCALSLGIRPLYGGSAGRSSRSPAAPQATPYLQ